MFVFVFVFVWSIQSHSIHFFLFAHQPVCMFIRPVLSHAGRCCRCVSAIPASPSRWWVPPVWGRWSPRPSARPSRRWVGDTTPPSPSSPRAGHSHTHHTVGGWGMGERKERRGGREEGREWWGKEGSVKSDRNR